MTIFIREEALLRNAVRYGDPVVRKSGADMVIHLTQALFNADGVHYGNAFIEVRGRRTFGRLVAFGRGIAFNVTHLNQAGALVHVYTDGSIALNHGGTEMGQGLHTKILGVAMRELGLPADVECDLERLLCDRGGLGRADVRLPVIHQRVGG